jgi:hypothetical protein
LIGESDEVEFAERTRNAAARPPADEQKVEERELDLNPAAVPSSSLLAN